MNPNEKLVSTVQNIMQPTFSFSALPNTQCLLCKSNVSKAILTYLHFNFQEDLSAKSIKFLPYQTRHFNRRLQDVNFFFTVSE